MNPDSERDYYTSLTEDLEPSSYMKKHNHDRSKTRLLTIKIETEQQLHMNCFKLILANICCDKKITTALTYKTSKVAHYHIPD